MTEPMLKDILEGINELKKRMDRIEWLILDKKFDEGDPTPEELAIIREYEKKKSDGKVEFSKFDKGSIGSYD
jgi:hypothetical protein